MCSAIRIDRGATWWRYGALTTGTSPASWNRLIPSAVARVRTSHNLDELAWKAVQRTEPTTLDYFMRDYVAHLEHHLRQALGERLGSIDGL